MNKKILKYLIVILLSLFSILYYFGTTIFQNGLSEKRDLTMEQIAKFEEDVKNGVEIDIKEYVVKDKTYDNLITNINKDISKFIGKGFKKIFKYLLKNIEN